MEKNGRKEPGHIAVTALCVIALLKYGVNTQGGAQYLAEHFEEISDPYELSITVYSLLLGNHPMAVYALDKLKSQKYAGKARISHRCSTVEWLLGYIDGVKLVSIARNGTIYLSCSPSNQFVLYRLI